MVGTETLCSYHKERKVRRWVTLTTLTGTFCLENVRSLHCAANTYNKQQTLEKYARCFMHKKALLEALFVEANIIYFLRLKKINTFQRRASYSSEPSNRANRCMRLSKQFLTEQRLPLNIEKTKCKNKHKAICYWCCKKRKET